MAFSGVLYRPRRQHLLVILRKTCTSLHLTFPSSSHQFVHTHVPARGYADLSRYTWLRQKSELEELRSLSDEEQSALDVNRRYFGLVKEQSTLPEHKTKHRLLIIQPHARPGATNIHSVVGESKWSFESMKPPEAELAEAKGLVDAVPGWTVAGTCIQPVTGSVKKRNNIWGRDKMGELAKMAASCSSSAVFVNMDLLSSHQRLSLSAAIRKPVYDRYGIVVAIFKAFATSAEARLQVQLAEIPYLRENMYSRLRPDGFKLAEGNYEYNLKVIRDRELWLQARLAKYSKTWQIQLDKRARQFHTPVVAVVGYTNAGKTTLINRLTQDSRAVGEDRLFATLNTQDYRSLLPNGLTAAFVDTVGFISHLPTALLPSFQATINYVKYADAIVHVCDASDPNYKLNKRTVMDTLSQLKVPGNVLDNVIHVNNKVDLLSDDVDSEWFEPGKNDVDVSCENNAGLSSLLSVITNRVTSQCGYKQRRLTVNSSEYGKPLELLQSLNQCVVQKVIPADNHETVTLQILCTDAAWSQFTSVFSARRKS